MAEDSARMRQYAYAQNSNLVLSADRESRRKRDEATGEVESLVGKMNYRMGDRAIRATPEEANQKKKRYQDQEKDDDDNQKKKKKKKIKKDLPGDHHSGASILFDHGETTGRTNILSDNLAFEAFAYRPKSTQTQEAYEQILNIVVQDLGAQPGEFLAGTAEEILAILKNDSYRDDIKHQEVRKLLKTITPDVFNRLVVLGKRITDFDVDGGENGGNGENQVKKHMDDMEEGDELDKEMGVAVVIDEEDEESESELDEVLEIEEDDEDENESDDRYRRSSTSRKTEGMRVKNQVQDEEMEDQESVKYRLDVQSIDAFWLQRELSKYYKDADISAKLAEDILQVLKESEDLSACENRLVMLLDYDKFDFIKLLLHNRYKVLYCTRLKQAQNEQEKQKIQQEMIENVPEGQGQLILKQLAATSSADSWMQDRIGAMETTSRAEAKKLRKLQQRQERARHGGGVVVDEEEVEDEDDEEEEIENDQKQVKPQRYIDVEALAFQEGGHLMSNKECRLPEGTWRAQKKGYEEVHVPAVKAKTAAEEERKRIQISSLPSWTHAAFKNMQSLNRVQSKMYKSAFETSENLLLCAPTGAGKTNVAMLTILHEVLKARDPETGEIDLDSFKIVYVAPMKALVQEVVLNLSNRLTAAYGIEVRELSGDQNLTRELLHRTQIIVTTPEKWDIITRKAGDDRSYTQLVRLVIIDEIHLLHDTRGAVLEALVARTLRTIEMSQQMVRLVGLSATLPNYEDVAAFLRVDPDKGLFYFDSSYRPVPLQQQYIGLMEKKAIKRFALMNEICYEKVMEQAELNNQVLIFVHSRKETAATAQALRDLAVENDALSKLIQPQSASSEILTQESEKPGRNQALKDLLPYGFGIHHAGMKREDRTLVEELFADGHLQVLVSTSTLAWGVNLPAHTVIIKGTQMYNAERGDWCELSPLDILQMLGRAGRVQYDTQGEGIIITQHSQLKYYLSLMNQQLPVESQFLKKLADHLNAEIVAGSIQNIQQAASWLGYTYLFIRMLKNPALYGVSPMQLQQDRTLLQYRLDLVHSAATLLAKHNLIKYERRTGSFQVTALGRVASHYYIVHDSIATYNEYLKPYMSDLELLRLFSLSNEFKYVVVRAEEKLELVKLLERVPVPVKESLAVGMSNSNGSNGSSAKVNVLLQAYISRLKLEGFALLADMVHIHQSAARIFRALFEICLTRGWAAMAEKTLNFCKMVDKRMWLSSFPLRQFSAAQIPDSLLRKLEKKDISWDRYVDLEVQDLGQLVNNPKTGKQLYRLIHQFPRLELSAHAQPITRSMLKVDFILTPDFEYNSQLHGNAQGFWVLVEDVDGENILHYEYLLIKKRFASHENYMSFTLPLFEPLAPLYYVRVISDSWLHCEFSLPVSFAQLVLPQKNPPPTELLDLQPLYVGTTLSKLVGLNIPKAKSNATLNKRIVEIILDQSLQRRHENGGKHPKMDVFGWHFKRFNPIQTQVIPRILETNANVLIASPPGSGKTILAELALVKKLLELNQLPLTEQQESEDDHLILYLTPKESLANERFQDWNGKFGAESCWQQDVQLLSGDATADLRKLARANLLIGTYEQMDVLSRRWKQRKRLQNIDLLIADEVHFVGGGETGPTMEVVLSRMRFISAEMDKKKAGRHMRLIGMCNSIANAKDVGEWLGSNDGIFNFHPNVRPQPMEIRVQGFEINDFASRMLAMSKPVYNSIVNNTRSSSSSRGSAHQHQPVIVFVPSSKQAQLSAIDLITFALAENDPFKFVPSKRRRRTGNSMEVAPIGDLPGEKDSALEETLAAGVGYIHDAQSTVTRSFVLDLYANGLIKVLVVPHTLCWDLVSAQTQAYMVAIMGTQYYDGKEHRYVDYQLADVLQMTKFANRRATETTSNGSILKCAIFCHTSKKKFYAKFLYDPLPVESQLEHFLSDHVNAEIVTKTIENKQEAVDYLTWTLMYRRLIKNPNYYNLPGATQVHLSDHLSELVESTVTSLEESRCIQVTEEDDGMETLSPLNLGMIAAYYYIKYTTIELFACSLTATTKMKGLIHILASSSEFSELPSRFGEDSKLERLAKHLKYPMVPGSNGVLDYSQPHVKANVLLQMHFSKQHQQLSAALRKDLDFVLKHAVRLIHAMVDVISSNGWLRPALAAMDLAQMVVQAQWNTDSPLMQVPFFTQEIISTIKKECEAADEDEVETPLDILSMDDDVRKKALPFPMQKMSAIAKFCNAYPDVDVETEIEDEDEITTGSAVTLKVQLARSSEEEEEEEEEDKEENEIGIVNACHYPVKKAENWWVVVGDAKKNTLLSIKRVPLTKNANLQLDFAAPEAVGQYTFQLYVICDGYAGCDLENEIKIKVLEGGDDDDDDDDEEEEGMDTED